MMGSIDGVTNGDIVAVAAIDDPDLSHEMIVTADSIMENLIPGALARKSYSQFWRVLQLLP